jgi:L-lactate utilization protein LutC
MVSEPNFQQAFPISLPEAWPSEPSEGEGEGSNDSYSSPIHWLDDAGDFGRSDSSNTTPTTHFSPNEADSGDTSGSRFDEPVSPQDSDFAFPESNIEEQEVRPIAAEDSDFAFPNTDAQMEQSSEDEQDGAGIPLSDYQLDEEVLETADELQTSADLSSGGQAHSSLAIADDEFQEEVTRVAALEAEVAHFDLAAEPVSVLHHVSPVDEDKKHTQTTETHSTHITQARFAATTTSIEEPLVVVIESRNTSTREVSLTPSEFATAEQQILTNRIVHIPGKVLILDAVAIFRQIDPGISPRRRRRSA